MSAMRPRRSWRTGMCMARADTIDVRHLLWSALVLLGFGVAGTSRADTVVVTADRMIDVVAGRVIEHPRITITDGRITAAGAGVDLPGMTLLPGLIDMHTHITSDPRYSGYRRLQFTDNFWTVVGVANARKTVE